jgi:hypothetical protein
MFNEMLATLATAGRWKARSGHLAVLMERLPIRAREQADIDRANIKCLVGQALARIERKFILQTLELQ